MVEVVTAEMRCALGLLPWPVWEARARDNYRAYLASGGRPDQDPDRGAGRSTRGALLALARALVEGRGAVHVQGDRHAVRLVKGLAGRLYLRVRVIDGDLDRSRGTPGGVVVHRDHHAAR